MGIRFLKGVSLLQTVIATLIFSGVAMAQSPWVLDTVVAAGSNCFGVAVTPDGQKILVTNKDTSGTVTVLSAADYSVLSTIPMYGDYPNVAITPDDKYAFVVGNWDVAVVSLGGDSVVQTFSAVGQNVAISPDGMEAYVTDSYNGELRVYKYNGTGTGILGPGGDQRVPETLELSQNYPNPFNPSTTISYGLPKSGFVEMKVFDVTGRSVATLVSGHQSAGHYEIRFDGSKLPSGVYFLRIEAGGLSQTRKMILMK